MSNQNDFIDFRASRFGDLCGSVTKMELTPKQVDELELLEKRKNGEGKPLTDNQEKTLESLIAKRDTPPSLDSMAKTWVKELFKENVRHTQKISLDNIYTAKGNEMESSAISRIASVNGWGMCVKSSLHLRDHIGTGHPDVYKKGIIGFDAKCSFSDSTFPLFDEVLSERSYIWQNKRYCMLTGMDVWYTCYSLENTPDNIVMQNAQKLWLDSGESGYITDTQGNFVSSTAKNFYDEVKAMHTFDHLADWERVKTFEVKLTNEDVFFAEKRHQMAIELYKELKEKYKSFKK